MEKYLKTYPSKWQNQYSPEFKRYVCHEFLTGTLSRRAVEHKFKLGNSRINFWLKELGYDYTKPRSVPLNIMAKRAQSKSNENETVEKLKKELEDAKLLAETYRRIIEKAEEEFKISIRKKSNTK
jgi:transposase